MDEWDIALRKGPRILFESGDIVINWVDWMVVK